MSIAAPTRLRTFVADLTRLLRRTSDERSIFADATPLLARLIAHDDWLPEHFAAAHPDHYQQYLLHCDGAERFSVVGFVWGPGQTTPIHDHRVWGMIGMLRGAEISEHWRHDAGGRFLPQGQSRLEPGAIDCVSPRLGDIHRVSNAYADQVSISIHVYGANIGAIERRIYQPDGTSSPFVSGYSNALLPNIWNPESPI